MDWDGCTVATVANPCGEPVLSVTARAGARFVNVSASEMQARLVEYDCLPMFFDELAPKRGKPITKHKLKRGAEILAAMKAVSWGPSVRSYVKGGSQCVGCMDSKANGTNFRHGAPELKKVVQLINEELTEWSRDHAPPGFGWTSLQLNANTVADWHVEYRNLGHSVIVVVGEHSVGQ